MVSHLAINSEADGNGSSDDVSPDAFSLSSNQRQIAFNAECTMGMKAADFPSTGGDPNIFERDCFHGGPVTAAYVRFPPHQYINTTTFDTKLNHEHMRSQGRVVFARGPWIESHSMFPYRSQDGGDSKQSYKVMAFGGDCEGGSTFESIQGMLFPTSSSSLSYLDPASEIYQDASSKSMVSSISVVAYGGRRLSFLSGGGLWNESASSSDEFITIPIRKYSGTSTHFTNTSYLEVSDWIHDARLLDLKEECSFLVALGMANNNCEIWGFHSSSMGSLSPTRLKCISCGIRCMTYSLSFLGWENNVERCQRSNHEDDGSIPSLVAASGTVFGEIHVWGIVVGAEKVDNSTDLSTIVKKWISSTHNATTPGKRNRIAPSYRLKGHLGSVFSVKFGCRGKYIASTSDDRSVRLWTLLPLDQSTAKSEDDHTRRSICQILEDNSTHAYVLTWTGWGHTARVWEVSFAHYPSHHQPNNSVTLVSAGEDSTARIWSPLEYEKEIVHPLRGHRCESLWTVDVCEGVIITGGNDGCIKMWDLESRVSQSQLSGGGVQTFVAPKDPVQLTPTSEQPSLMPSAIENDTSSSSQKKKRKKSKPKGQVIFGMEFFSSNELMVATRAGGLFSLDIAHYTWTTHKDWSQNIVTASCGIDAEIDPSTGNCIGIYSNDNRLAIGTTDGWLILSHISAIPSTNVAFRAESYRSVQSLSWIDGGNLLVFFARGTIIWWRIESNNLPVILHIMALGTDGVPVSFAYDAQDCSLYVGDTRGHLSFFDVSQSVTSKNGNRPEERSPDSVLDRAHGREHVTGITILRSGTVVSVGNDGHIQQSDRDPKGQLRKILSISIPNVTGLRDIWNVCHPDGREGLVVSGYYGNDFVLIDVLHGYEFLRIATGGRQRRQEMTFSFANDTTTSLRSPSFYGMAICTGQADGCSLIDFHSSGSFNDVMSSFQDISPRRHISTLYNIGFPIHSEVINDLCWIDGGDEAKYLLTGSNDCTVKLSKLQNGKFLSVQELPPHESCVRGVCSSRRPASDVSLLATCGGKLSKLYNSVVL